MPTYIKDLFDLPDVVRGGDFVLRLAEGLERPEQTLRDYVVTPQLAKCFDEALSLVRDALEGKTSKSCYLLGSFGSGKSHHPRSAEYMQVRKKQIHPRSAEYMQVRKKQILISLTGRSLDLCLG